MTTETIRKTMFRRGDVYAAVITYTADFLKSWRTLLTVFAADNPSIWNEAQTQNEAYGRHDEVVRMMKLMGFEEVKKNEE